MGKSTVFVGLTAHLKEMGHDVVATREPGGTEMAEQIRQVLLKDYDEPMVPVTELLLMFASRAQHVKHIIEPALRQGKTVVCDRFVDASYAYQGGGRGLAPELLDTLACHTVSILPDITFLLDADPSIGMERIRQRSQQDRIEKEQYAFFSNVRAAYHQRATQDPKRFHVIDAAMAQDEVLAAVQQKIEAWHHEHR